MRTDTQQTAVCKSDEPERTTKSLLDKWTFINRINGDPELQPTAKVVASYLMWRMNCRYETCFPARETIAADLNLSIRCIHVAVKALKDRGWLTWQRRRDQSSIYRFVWDRASADRESYVANDMALRQEPRQEPETVRDAVSETAKSDTLTTGIDITRERSSHLSTPSASRDGQPAENPSPVSAEKKASPDPAPPLQEGSPEWWKTRVWNETGIRFKEKFYPTISLARFKSRLGETLRRTGHDIPAVDRAMCAAIEAVPGGDAWEYVTGILREKAERGPDYSKPLQTRGVM